jgi:hypothetical protein
MKTFWCSGEGCGNEICYGDIVVKGGPGGLLCEHCARKTKARGEAIVHRPIKVEPTSVQRDRARKNLKRLDRMQRRTQKVIVSEREEA